MIKILACVLMLVDHIGHAFYPGVIELRFIGRLSMPLFAYAIARGAFHTRDRKKYIMRIAGLAVVSQVPFAMFLNVPLFSNLNIAFTWLFALLIIDFYENEKLSRLIKYFLVAVVIAITTFVKMDYGLYAVLIVLAFYYLLIKNNKFFEVFFLYFLISIVPIGTTYLQAGAFDIGAVHMAAFQFVSILALPIIKYAAPNERKLKVNKYVFYWFYPVHMAVIVGVSYLL